MHQHIPEHARYDAAPSSLTDTVQTAAGSTLATLYGSSVAVNSLHHQTVDAVGNDLVVTARSSDGTIEGLEHTMLPIIAVQWHPEMLDTRDSDPAFAWIVREAQRHQRDR